MPFCFEAAFYYDYSTPFYRQTERLNILVASCKIESHWSKRTKAMTQERIDWNAVGKALGRVPIDCKRKWRSSQVPSNTQNRPGLRCARQFKRKRVDPGRILQADLREAPEKTQVASLMMSSTPCLLVSWAVREVSPRGTRDGLPRR